VGIRLKGTSYSRKSNNTTRNVKMGSPWEVVKKWVEKSHVASTKSHGGAKRAPDPMKNLSMGARMEIGSN